MRSLLAFGRLYPRVDAFLSKLLPEHIRLWFKGSCVAAAKGLLPTKLGKSEGMPDILPAWAYAAVREAAIDEPELLPELLVPYLRRMSVPTGGTPLGLGYANLWRQIDQCVRHVFILGDSDGRIPELLLAAIKWLAVERSGQVLVVWTGSSGAGSDDSFPQARQIDLEKASGLHRTMEQAIVLGRALLEIKPATIHVASSATAWMMFRNMAAALSESSQLYAEITPISYFATDTGRDAHEIERSIASGLPPSLGFVASSERVIEQWVAHHGMDAAMIRLVSDAASAAVGSGFVDCGIQPDWLCNLPGYAEQ